MMDENEGKRKLYKEGLCVATHEDKQPNTASLVVQLPV